LYHEKSGNPDQVLFPEETLSLITQKGGGALCFFRGRNKNFQLENKILSLEIINRSQGTRYCPGPLGRITTIWRKIFVISNKKVELQGKKEKKKKKLTFFCSVLGGSKK
jgi:hypothetical protein